MKKNFLILVLVTIVIIMSGIYLSQKPAEHAAVQNEKLPLEISLLDQIDLPEIEWLGIDQQPISISENQYTLVNFWASWCAPCVVEFPEIIEFAKENKNFNIVFVSNDLKQNDIEKFITSLSDNAQNILRTSDNIFMVWDKGGTITRDVFQTYKLPETYILDQQQRAIAKINGVLSADAYTYLSDY